MLNLPLIMASMTISEDRNDDEDSVENSRRILRRRPARRSLSLEPKRTSSRLKQKNDDECSEEELKKIYLNNKVLQPPSSSLETIYEEPQERKNGSLRLTSVTRMKRWIPFDESRLKSKIKKRRERIKKLRIKRYCRTGVLTMDAVRNKLRSLSPGFDCQSGDDFASTSDSVSSEYFETNSIEFVKEESLDESTCETNSSFVGDTTICDSNISILEEDISICEANTSFIEDTSVFSPTGTVLQSVLVLPKEYDDWKVAPNGNSVDVENSLGCDSISPAQTFQSDVSNESDSSPSIVNENDLSNRLNTAYIEPLEESL